MSTGPFDPDSMQAAPQPMPTQSKSGASKALIIVAVVFGVLLLLCCGGVAVFFYFAQSYVGDALSTDPATVRQVTDRIAPLEVPDVLKPQFSMDMKVPFTDEPMMKMVGYADSSNQSTLVLAAFGEAVQGQNEAQMEAQMKQSLREQNMGPDSTVTVTEQFEREIPVRGEAVTFEFSRGTYKDPQSGEERSQISAVGSFKGAEGTVVLMVQADEKTLDEDQIVKMIESIK